MIGKSQYQAVFALFGFDDNFGSVIAVKHGIAQKIVKHPLHLIRITFQQNIIRSRKAAGKPLSVQYRLKLIYKLLQQAGKIDLLILQCYVRQAVSRNFQEFVD